jgi:hypothetical protein
VMHLHRECARVVGSATPDDSSGRRPQWDREARRLDRSNLLITHDDS